MASNIGNSLSPDNIATALKKDGQINHNNTVEKYLEYLVTSFVFYKVHRFALKGRKQLATQEKYHLVDAGIAQCFSGQRTNNRKRNILENIVFLELLRRGNKIWTDSDRNSKVGFICKTPTGDMEYYQIVWQMTDEKTIEREFSALEKIKDNYPKNLLAKDGFTQDRNGIRHLNVYAWLLCNRESHE